MEFIQEFTMYSLQKKCENYICLKWIVNKHTLVYKYYWSAEKTIEIIISITQTLDARNVFIEDYKCFFKNKQKIRYLK